MGCEKSTQPGSTRYPDGLAIMNTFRSDRQGQPKNVGVAVKIESHAKVSYKGGHILKLSDKVTMTRAFTARKKNRPAILFFS